MKMTRKALSFVIAAALILTVLPLSFVSGSAVTDESLKLNRPMANLYVTPVTRVAYAQNSMLAPSGNNSVIVKSTPSGMPYFSSTKTAVTYAGETPAATQIAFTPGVTLDSEPVLSCSNSTVKWNTTPVYSNGTYTWSVISGSAVVGSSIVFNVSYTYSETNPITGKTYTNTYVTSGTTHVEAIASPAGVYTVKRTYENWGLGTTTKNRSYVASYILGQNTYGSIYNNGSPDGSVAFDRYSWTIDNSGWTDAYGNMKKFDGSDASRNYNVAFGVDGNRPVATVYFDTSINSTLSDLNLRMVATNLTQSDESDERVTVTLNNFAVLDGNVRTFDGSGDDFNLTSDEPQKSQLNIIKPSSTLFAIGSTLTSYFTGVGPGTDNTAADYTIAYQFKTSAGWNDVFVVHNYSLHVVTYNKGALRTLVENMQSLDPTVMTTSVPNGDFKGYNPQSWYYSEGWENFYNALNSAKAIIEKPNTTQAEIDAQCTALRTAYNNLEMKTADYTVTSAYYNQAMSLNPNNYTHASWAKLQTMLDNYCSDYSVLYQPAVDKLGTDIKAAINALEERTADYTAFLDILNTVNNLMRRAQTNYGKPASVVYSGWANVVSVLNKSGCVYNELDGYTIENYLLVSEQAMVDGYVLLLENAIDKISLSGANYAAATSAENAYKVVKLNYVDDNIVPSLTSAYNELVALHGLDISRQADIDAATNNLNYWLGRIIYKPANIQAAENLIAYANSLDRSFYNDFSAVDSAIANLQSKLSLDIRYQGEIDRAVSGLQSALDRLLANSADYSLVDQALEAVAERERIILEAYVDTYGFTAATFYSNWSNVVTAVNGIIRGLDINQQSTVNGFASAINTALDNLQENTADYTQVSSLQNTAYSLCTNGVSLYTQESLNNLLMVYMSVEGNLPISRQAEVDAFASDIQQAIDSLEFLPANYSNVNAQIISAQAKINADEAYSIAHPGYTLYTSESLADVAVAIAEVVDGLDVRYQSTVNGYASNISNAIASLEYGPADYTAVYAALAGVPEDTSLYTTLSLTTLNTTVNNINYNYTADKQATVDRYVTSINNAIAKLKYKGADYTQVNAALRRVPADSSVYTEDSWQAVQDQVNAVVTGLDITHQSEVDQMAVNLNTAIGFLAYKGADYSAVEAAKAEIPADLSVYTDESVAVLNNALDAVDYYCNITQQATVDGYAEAITNAVNGLTVKGADYTAVNDAVNAANTKINSGLYTDESVAVVQEKINAVDYTCDITMQESVYTMAQEINDAADAMQYKNASYSLVESAIAAANAKINSGLYTDESITAVQNAIAQVVESLDITHQSEVDIMAQEINDAADAMQYKNASYSLVESAIAAANAKINSGLYTDESITAVQNAIAQVVESLDITHQSEVDIMAQAINDAADAMQYKPADYEALNAAKSDAEEKTATGYYTDESVAALQTELDKIVLNLDITHQDEIDNLASDIVKATKDLVLKLANYTELQNILNLLDNSSSEIYTITYSNFNEVMSLITAYRTETVEEKMNLTIDRQAEVDEMRDTLQGYIDSLEPVVATEKFELAGGAALRSGKYIVGLKQNLTRTEFERNYTVQENVSVSYSNSASRRVVGTGTVITVTSTLDPGKVIATYTVVVFGDVDGDGIISSKDATMVESSLSGSGARLNAAQTVAADVEGRRAGVDSNDSATLYKASTKKVVISQVTGKVI